jgi:hypothetical protein
MPFHRSIAVSQKTTGFVMSAALHLRRQFMSGFADASLRILKQQRSQSSSSMVQKILTYVKKLGHVRPFAGSVSEGN